MLCQFKNFVHQPSTQVYRSDKKQQQQQTRPAVSRTLRVNRMNFSPLRTVEGTLFCQTEVLYVHPEPDPRPAAAPPRDTSQKLASTILNGAFTSKNLPRHEKFPWSLQRDGGVRGRHEAQRRIYLSLRGGGLRGSANQCRASSPVCTWGLTSYIISIDWDSDRCRPRPPEAPKHFLRLNEAFTDSSHGNGNDRLLFLHKVVNG